MAHLRFSVAWTFLRVRRVKWASHNFPRDPLTPSNGISEVSRNKSWTSHSLKQPTISSPWQEQKQVSDRRNPVSVISHQGWRWIATKSRIDVRWAESWHHCFPCDSPHTYLIGRFLSLTFSFFQFRFWYCPFTKHSRGSPWGVKPRVQLLIHLEWTRRFEEAKQCGQQIHQEHASRETRGGAIDPTKICYETQR